MAYDRGDLSALQGDETCKDTLQAALKGQTTANVGYQNNTGLPMVLEQVRGGSTMDEGTVYGGVKGKMQLFRSVAAPGAQVKGAVRFGGIAVHPDFV